MELLQQIQSINDYTDQKIVRKIQESLYWLNILDERNKAIFEAARQKGLM